MTFEHPQSERDLGASIRLYSGWHIFETLRSMPYNTSALVLAWSLFLPSCMRLTDGSSRLVVVLLPLFRCFRVCVGHFLRALARFFLKKKIVWPSERVALDLHLATWHVQKGKQKRVLSCPTGPVTSSGASSSRSWAFPLTTRRNRKRPFLFLLHVDVQWYFVSSQCGCAAAAARVSSSLAA